MGLGKANKTPIKAHILELSSNTPVTTMPIGNCGDGNKWPITFIVLGLCVAEKILENTQTLH